MDVEKLNNDLMNMKEKQLEELNTFQDASTDFLYNTINEIFMNVVTNELFADIIKTIYKKEVRNNVNVDTVDFTMIIKFKQAFIPERQFKEEFDGKIQYITVAFGDSSRNIIIEPQKIDVPKIPIRFDIIKDYREQNFRNVGVWYLNDFISTHRLPIKCKSDWVYCIKETDDYEIYEIVYEFTYNINQGD